MEDGRAFRVIVNSYSLGSDEADFQMASYFTASE